MKKKIFSSTHVVNIQSVGELNFTVRIFVFNSFTRIPRKKE